MKYPLITYEEVKNLDESSYRLDVRHITFDNRFGHENEKYDRRFRCGYQGTHDSGDPRICIDCKRLFIQSINEEKRINTPIKSRLDLID